MSRSAARLRRAGCSGRRLRIIRLPVALDCKVMDLVGAFDKTDLRALLPK